MTFNFSWKNLVGLGLIIASVVVALISDLPVAVFGAIVCAVAGAVLTIKEELKKTSLSGWKEWVFLLGTIGGTVLFTLGGYSDATIMTIVGAVIVVASVIFGIAFDKKSE